MKNYIKEIRKKVGSDKIIHPAARIIVENKNNEILIIERCDNGLIGLPAGAIEEGETIEECIKREVREETGLILTDLEVIGISSNPNREIVKYPNGDIIQYFTIEFYSKNWKGDIKIIDKKEVRKAQFVNVRFLKDLPPNEVSILESLKHYRETGKIMLK
jgi:ADP-ribose pyrophosphatase YjhB (NUDIX family)